MSLFDPLDHKVLLPEMEEIEGEPIICQALFGPLGLPEWLSIFLGTNQGQWVRTELTLLALQVERIRRGGMLPGVRPRPRQPPQLRRVLRHDECQASQRTGNAVIKTARIQNAHS